MCPPKMMFQRFVRRSNRAFFILIFTTLTSSAVMSAAVSSNERRIAAHSIDFEFRKIHAGLQRLATVLEADNHDAHFITTEYQDVAINAVDICSQLEVVKLAKAQAEELLRSAFDAANASADVYGIFGKQEPNQVIVSVGLSQFREYQAYDGAIKKRFCEASALIKLSGLSGVFQMSLAVVGITPQLLSDGVSGTVRYSIQLTEDGTQLVVLEDKHELEGFLENALR